MAISKLSDKVRLLGTSLKNLNPTAIYNKVNEIVDKLNNESPISYKVYSAVISQSGIAKPTVTVLENSLGEELEWTRSNVGQYATTSTLFEPNKVLILHSGSDWGNIRMIEQSYKVEVFTTDTTTATPIDDVLSKTSIQIRVYN